MFYIIGLSMTAIIIAAFVIVGLKSSADSLNTDGQIATIQLDDKTNTSVKTVNIKWHSDGQLLIKVDSNRTVISITQNSTQNLKSLSNPTGAAVVGYAANGDTVVVLTPGIIELSAENTGTGFSVYENGVYPVNNNQ